MVKMIADREEPRAMTIDFHAHIFPDKIAEKTIHSMEKQAGIKAFYPGCLSGLKQSMKEGGIDYSVVLPVVTKPAQFESINRFAAGINGKDGIFSFGGIHPDNEDIPEKLAYIRSLGLKGIKLHPDYQGPTYIDDPRYIRILKECIRQDLCCVIHAGMDVGIPVPIHCPPDRAYLMLNEVLKDCRKDSKIVLAHMGGHMQWELVEKMLVGQNVYFDLAYSIKEIDRNALLRIIKNHGAKRILFATDFPWSSQKESVRFVKSLPLPQNDIDDILYRNGAGLLGL